MSVRQVVVHGHFYQPPREEPWLDLVPRETTAAPFHDWNERITAECYAPLIRGRVLDDAGQLRRVIHTWSWLSFDVGPTLFRWFDRHAAPISHAIVEADRASRERLGHGNAVAMPYHHIILPLASRRDKQTEVRWGIRDFQNRFGRIPEGMWLPETAVDEETLEVLAEEGIRFTILAPHQLHGVPPFGRPGRWRSASGRELALFAYDGAIAHDLAFGNLLAGADAWMARIGQAPVPQDGGPMVVSMATDGETFGHHHRGGDTAVAGLIDRMQHRDDMRFTNFAAILSAHPPVDDVQLVSPSSWSCIHGIERWRNDCGCGYEPNSSQAWRAPLRAGLEVVAQGIHALFVRDWPASAGDPWQRRDDAGPELSGVSNLPVTARELLEAERHALAMFTSCGWFFDDIGRIEPRINLRHAARALEFVPEPARGALGTALLSAIADTHSKDPSKGSGWDIWHRDVLTGADGPAALAAGLAALRDLVPEALDDLAMPSHQWRLDGERIVLTHRPTGQESRWEASTHTAGVVAWRVEVTKVDEESDTRSILAVDFPAPVRSILGTVARPIVFDAALTAEAREALRDGTIDLAAARELAFRMAWDLVAKDGVEDAGIVVHGALDLYDLEGELLPELLRAEAFLALLGAAPSPEREMLARRIRLVLPE